MVERYRLDADLHLAIARRRRRRDVGEFKFTIGNQLQRTHGGPACPALGRLKPHHQRNILPAKSE